MLESKPELFGGVLDSMQDMLRVLDIEQRVVLTNKSYLERFGAQQGKICTEMFNKTTACANCVARRSLKTGSQQQKKTRNRGRIYWVKASPLFDSCGCALGTVEVFRDITSQVKKNREISEQNRLLLQDAEFAARMQHALFHMPEYPSPGVSAHASYLPASSMGGDMLGFSRQPDGKLAFYIADVSGHGFSAAMVTLLLRGALSGIRINSPSELLSFALKAFLAMGLGEQVYVSMFAALLNPKDCSLEWANAGLNATPLLVVENRLERLFQPSLPLCNWKEDIPYESKTTRMLEGSRLFLYTDGLLDRKSTKLTETLLVDAVKNTQGRALIKKLEQEVLPIRNDDVCMLLVSLSAKDNRL